MPRNAGTTTSPESRPTPGLAAQDALDLLCRRAELHELAAERFFVLGDADNGERERRIATTYRDAATRRQAQLAAMDAPSTFDVGPT